LIGTGLHRRKRNWTTPLKMKEKKKETLGRRKEDCVESCARNSIQFKRQREIQGKLMKMIDIGWLRYRDSEIYTESLMVNDDVSEKKSTRSFSNFFDRTA
jgi:hypothetical protein